MNKKHLACLAVIGIAATPMFANVAMADGKLVPAFTHITPEKVEAAAAPLHIANVTDGGKTFAVLCHGGVAAVKCVARDGSGKVTPVPASARKKGSGAGWHITITLPTPMGPIIIDIGKDPAGGSGTGTSTGSGSAGSAAPKAPPPPRG